ncbi:hypothetical protein BGZ96_004528 [Linnemannia gamsii]|uniref:F-box domain-containing protein n=1 Tax=Linnemannia gamsii TaxID=64522 RepID=A0ABQ7K6V6_9FUNG|nr:hypothetical protein BGZ96_004528 [Linnemannia gamsii]
MNLSRFFPFTIGSSVTYINIDNIATATSSQQLALSIPEILELILSFLLLNKRQGAARLVCKQWYAVCKGHVPVSYTWILPLTVETNSKSNDTQETLELISHAQILVIKINYHVTHRTAIVSKNRVANWTKMMGTLSTIILEREHQCLKSSLRTFHLREGTLVNFATQLTQLPLLTTLTTFSIDTVIEWDIIHLFTIFRVCPNLVELTVEPTLAAKEASHVDYIAFQALLEASPWLSKLVLERYTHIVRPGQDTTTLLDPIQDHAHQSTGIIRLVGAHCPGLKSFHMSKSPHGYGLRTCEAIALFETFPQMEECTSTSREICPVLLKTLNTTTTVNQITTLNLLPTPSMEFIPTRLAPFDVSLRKILCTFEHLLHLRAPLTAYYMEDMELDRTKQQMRNDWNHKRGNTTQMPLTSANHSIMNQYRYTWACRGLRTLHMTVGHKPEHPDYPGMSLVIFSYLSRMCPQLQELHLVRWSICLKFNGGLCLLARLRHLKRLRLVSSTTCYVNEKYLFWMDPTPPTPQQQQYPVSMLDRLVYPLQCRLRDRDFRRWYRYVPAAVSAAVLEIVPEKDDEHAWWEGLGYIDDLLDWMEDWTDTIVATTSSPGRRLLLPLWPNLESFWIKSNLRTGPVGLRKSNEFLTRVLPGVDIQLRSIQDNSYLATMEVH